MAFDLTLTFDNGPTAATPVVLDLLAEHGVRATFFVIGRQLVQPQFRAFAERAVAEGHWIGNHSFTHGAAFGLRDGASTIAEVVDTEQVIGGLGRPNRLFRPHANGGLLDQRVFNREVVDYLQAEQFTVVLWNAVPRDWESRGWVETAIEQCLTTPWSLMVLHDDHHRAIPGLERFLPLAIAAGARFRQDFPDECVPIDHGRAARSLDALTMPAASTPE